MAISKTGVEVDTNNTFENADVFEENGAVNSITVSGLNADTSYYVRAYVIQDGNKIYGSEVETFQTTAGAVDYFYVENEYNGQNTFSLNKNNSPDIQNIEWSKDKSTWTAFDLSQSQNDIVLEEGEKLYLRNDSGYFSKNSGNYYKINCSENYSVGGNINTLLDYTDLRNVSLSQYCFYGLFYNSTTLISAQYLLLPATTLADSCYSYMFNGCTALVNAPSLPATTLTINCYSNMFNGCSSLTTAPELPATALGIFCYYQMFRGCTSLTTAPSLPATTLVSNCYIYMFLGCSSLTTAPSLPATTLAQGCYQGMFRDCSSLNSITTHADDISANSCLYNWLDGVSATGTFHNLGSASYPSGVSGIPSGWTEVHN